VRRFILVNKYYQFGETYCLHFLIFWEWKKMFFFETLVHIYQITLRNIQKTPVLICTAVRTLNLIINAQKGARGSVVGWGTILQAGRSLVRFPMRSLDFSMNLILPAALWSWGRPSLQQKWVPGIFLWRKRRLARKADNLTDICEPLSGENVGASTSHNPMCLHGLLQE
jgi:hypothetical protein